MFCVPFTAVIACRRVGDVSDFQVGLRADKASRAVFLGRLMRGRGKSGGFLAGPYEAGGRCAILLRRFVYRAAADTSRRRSRSGRYRPLRLRRRTKCREVRRISGGPPCSRLLLVFCKRQAFKAVVARAVAHRGHILAAGDDKMLAQMDSHGVQRVEKPPRRRDVGLRRRDCDRQRECTIYT